MSALVLANIVPLACVAGAVILLLLGVQDGWGWLLLIALLTHVTPKVTP